MKRLAAAFALILSCTGCDRTAESADSRPVDLRGNWVGTSDSIVRGTALHHAAATGAQPLVDHVQFTLTITGQDSRRFWGTVSGGSSTEPVIGVIGYDGKTIVARDTDGVIEGTLVDPDTIDSIYSHNNAASAVVAANRWKRQK